MPISDFVLAANMRFECSMWVVNDQTWDGINKLWGIDARFGVSKKANSGSLFDIQIISSEYNMESQWYMTRLG